MLLLALTFRRLVFRFRYFSVLKVTIENATAVWAELRLNRLRRECVRVCVNDVELVFDLS